MRGPALDTRPTGIESVTPYWIRTSDEDYDPILATVPKPVVDVNSFYREKPLAKTTTVFVGEYIYRESQYFAGQGTISMPGTFQYITGETTPSWGAVSGGTPYRVLTGNVVGVARTDLGPADVLVLGASSSATNANNTSWGGPFRALVFDTELTEAQIQAVTNWLMDGHYLDAPGTPIGKPELPDGNLNEAGRNLLLNSATVGKNQGVGPGLTVTRPNGLLRVVAESDNGNFVSVNMGLSIDSADIPNGDLVTFSIDARSEDSIETPDMYLGNGMSYKKLEGDLGVEWSRIYYTRPWLAGPNFKPHFGFLGREGVYEFRNAKLERGSIVTAWTPAPEDDYDYWQPTRPTTEPDTSIWRTYLEVREDGTYRYRMPTRIA